MATTTEELAAQAAEQMRLHEEAKAESERKQDAAKSHQNASLQDKLNARLKKKEEKLKLEQEKMEQDKLKKAGLLKVLILRIS